MNILLRTNIIWDRDFNRLRSSNKNIAIPQHHKWLVPGPQWIPKSTDAQVHFIKSHSTVSPPYLQVPYQCIQSTSTNNIQVLSRSVMSDSFSTPKDCSSTGSSVQGIFQARILEWVIISSSRGSSQPGDQTHISGISCIGRWILYHWEKTKTKHKKKKSKNVFK